MFFLLIPCTWAASINGDLSIDQDTTCNTLQAETITTAGSIAVDSSIITETLSSTYLSTDTLTVSSIKSNSGSIVIEGNLVLEPQNSSPANFFQKTWTMAHQDSFENSNQAWSTSMRDHCNEVFHLKGDCNTPEIFKTFELTQHHYIRLTGVVHLLDLWTGERLEIKVDGKTVWSRVGKSVMNGINVCGLEHPDPGFATKFDVMVPHQKQEALVSFVSNFDEKNCHGSFAVSEIAVLSR